MLNREGGLINFPPLKRGGLFERGGLIEDLRYMLCEGPSNRTGKSTFKLLNRP